MRPLNGGVEALYRVVEVRCRFGIGVCFLDAGALVLQVDACAIGLGGIGSAVHRDEAQRRLDAHDRLQELAA
jgi:hypothetical protein